MFDDLKKKIGFPAKSNTPEPKPIQFKKIEHFLRDHRNKNKLITLLRTLHDMFDSMNADKWVFVSTLIEALKGRERPYSDIGNFFWERTSNSPEALKSYCRQMIDRLEKPHLETLVKLLIEISQAQFNLVNLWGEIEKYLRVRKFDEASKLMTDLKLGIVKQLQRITVIVSDNLYSVILERTDPEIFGQVQLLNIGTPMGDGTNCGALQYIAKHASESMKFTLDHTHNTALRANFEILSNKIRIGIREYTTLNSYEIIAKMMLKTGKFRVLMGTEIDENVQQHVSPA